MKEEFSSPAQITVYAVAAPLDPQFLYMNRIVWSLPIALSFCDPGKAGERDKEGIAYPSKPFCIMSTAYI